MPAACSTTKDRTRGAVAGRVGDTQTASISIASRVPYLQHGTRGAVAGRAARRPAGQGKDRRTLRRSAPPGCGAGESRAEGAGGGRPRTDHRPQLPGIALSHNDSDTNDVVMLIMYAGRPRTDRWPQLPGTAAPSSGRRRDSKDNDGDADEVVMLTMIVILTMQW